MNYTEAKEWRRKIEAAAANQSDADALESIDLFPKWAVGVAVKVDERYRYEGKLYKVIQAHTTQADWTPDIVPALFKEVSVEQFPEWVRPTGAHDAYNIGDKVTFEGKRYESLINGNVWSPIEYVAGWQEIN